MFRSILLTSVIAVAPVAIPAATYAEGPATASRPAQAGPLDRVRHVLEQLDLTDQQKAQAKDILEAAREKIKPLLVADKGDPAKRRAEVQPIVQDAFKQIRELLTNEQKAKLREIMEKRREAKESAK